MGSRKTLWVGRWCAAAVVAAIVLSQWTAGTTQASTGGPILYVDGKTGYDNAVGYAWSTDWGRSPQHPFKTVERALEETRHGSPAAIRIRGYDDYVYHETLTRGYRMGTATTPVVISAYTAAELPSGPWIRPTIDGGLAVGATGWSRPWAGSYPHVWCKTWRPPSPNLVTGQRVPPGYDTQFNSTHEDRLYLDSSQPLHRPAVIPTIAQLNARPYTEYWDRTKTTNNLCVHLGWWTGGVIDENPAHHTITVPWYVGIVLAGGSSYVTIRDLRVQHTVMGIGISVASDPAIGKAHDNSVIDVDASYNYRMGFWTAGDANLFDGITGSRNSIQLVKLDSGKYANGVAYGAQHNTIRNAVSSQNLGHGIKLYGRLVRYNVIDSAVIEGSGIPSSAKSAGGATQGVQISNGASYNTLENSLIVGTNAGVELYQYDTSGGPLVGNAVHNNRFEHVSVGVFLWDRKVSSSFGTGATTFSHNVYYDTQNAIGGNGTTSGKVFDHETIRHSGFRVGPTTPSVDKAGVELLAGSITIRNSIIDDTNGPSICAKSGATVSVSYSDTYRWRKDPRTSMPHGTFCASTPTHRFGVVKAGSGIVHVDPAYSTDPTAPDFLVPAPTSLVTSAASDRTRLGAL